MPEKLSVTAQVPEKKKDGKVVQVALGPATISIDTGKTAREMIEMFSDEAVKTNATANWVVTLQNNIRSGLRKGETQEQMQARLGPAKMGISSKGATVDPVQAYQAQFLSATADEQIKMVKELQRRAAELRGK